MKENLYIMFSMFVVLVDFVIYMFISFVSTLVACMHFLRSTMEIR